MALKVYDLECEHGHMFEGWFGSDDNYESQRARGLLSCPVCSSQQVSKKLSAPRLNVSHIRAGDQAAPAKSEGQGQAAQMSQAQAEALRRIRELVRATENVGDRFATEARRMHEGEAEERAIRGTATRAEREELAAEGIAVMPIPDFLDDDRMQ